MDLMGQISSRSTQAGRPSDSESHNFETTPGAAGSDGQKRVGSNGTLKWRKNARKKHTKIPSLQSARKSFAVPKCYAEHAPSISKQQCSSVQSACSSKLCQSSNVTELTSIKEPKYKIFFVSTLQICRIFQDALDSRFHVPCFWCASIITSADFRPKWRPPCPVARRQRSPRVHFSMFLKEGPLQNFCRRLEELGEWFRFSHGILMILLPTMIFQLKTKMSLSRAKDKEPLFYHTTTLMMSHFFLREID